MYPEASLIVFSRMRAFPSHELDTLILVVEYVFGMKLFPLQGRGQHSKTSTGCGQQTGISAARISPRGALSDA
jgi:hypothetical protein